MDGPFTTKARRHEVDTKKETYGPLPSVTDEIAKQIVDSAFKVHATLGPGLLESVYETCLVHELKSRGLEIRQQVPVSISYEGLQLGSGLRLDLLVADRVVVEIKATEKILPVHLSQLLTYLKLADKRLGLLINFNVPLIKDGIKRLIR